jgi:TPR repeat protein
MYQNEQGVPQDYHKAMEFYLKSANQEHVDAQLKIGIYSFQISF